MQTATALGKEVAKEGAMEGIGGVKNSLDVAAYNKANKQANMQFDVEQAEQGQEAEQKVNQLYSGMNFAKGGEVGLQEGQFIIPADVVSALGNGSTKAGASFLDEFFKV